MLEQRPEAVLWIGVEPLPAMHQTLPVRTATGHPLAAIRAPQSAGESYLRADWAEDLTQIEGHEWQAEGQNAATHR